MSVNVNALPVVTELNASDKIPAVISSSNEGRTITMANLGAQAAAGYTSSRLRGTAASGNLANITDLGVYYLSPNNSYTGMPSGITWGILEVTSTSTGNTTVMQTLTGTGGRTFKRIITSANVGAWQELVQGSVQVLRGTASSDSVTFATPFKDTPAVVCTVHNASITNGTLVVTTAVSTTGFSVWRKYLSSGGAWVDSSTAYHWIAIGPALDITTT